MFELLSVAKEAHICDSRNNHHMLERTNQGVTNIKFWYKHIFEYIYIQKKDTNEYPNIFV